MEEKLAKLRGGAALVRPEERKAVDDIYAVKISQWRKRKRMFKDLWDALTENSPKNLKEFKVMEVPIKLLLRLPSIFDLISVNHCRKNLELSMMKMLE